MCIRDRHHPISDLMTETMSKIKEMVDVNTIIGNPLVAADGTTVIPVSKVSFGFEMCIRDRSCGGYLPY